MLHPTVNFSPCGGSGEIVALHEPRTLWSASLVSEKVTVDGAVPPLTPPRFSITADSSHGSPQDPWLISFCATESTRYSGGQVVGSSKSKTLLGAWIPKSLP